MTQTPVPPDADRTEQQQQQHEQQPGERRVVVRFGIALATLLFVVASGVLYVRWATMREPTCVFIVEAPTTLRGAEVLVDGINVPKPHTATIGRGERFAIPFYLDYGTYSVRVTMNGESIVQTEVVLDRSKPYQRIDLKNVQPPPSPPGGAAGAAAAATTSRSDLGMPAVEPDLLRGLAAPRPPSPPSTSPSIPSAGSGAP